MAAYRGEISGARWNMLVDEIAGWFEEQVQFYVEMLTEDGYPPFTQPLGEREQYERLVAWYMSGDQRFWDNPGANDALTALEARFGPRPPLSPYNQPYPRIG